MIHSYQDLKPESKIFIYPGSRKFYPNELPELYKALTKFCNDFEGIDVSFKLAYDRFIVFVVSDNTPLNLDQQNSLVDFIQSLEKSYGLVLLDKVNVCFKQGQYVQMKEIPDFKVLIKNKGISKKTIVFDHMVTTKYEFENFWEVPAGDSWLSHFF